MLRTSLRLALVLALPMLTVALASTASANVRTSMVGAGCTAAGNPTPPANYQYQNQTGAIMVWDQTGADPYGHAVSCALRRALPLSTTGLSDLELRFQAWQMNQGTKEVFCEAFSLRSDGTVLDSATRSVQVPSATATNQVAPVVLMDFGSALNVSSSKGAYHVRCYLPVNIALHNVYHSEVDGIDGN